MSGIFRLSVGILFLAGACAPLARLEPTAATVASTLTAVPTLAATGAVQPAPIATPSPEAVRLCSPLQGIALSELTSPDLLKTAFVAPRPGYDDGHPGLDWAYWTRDGQSMLGLPVQAMLAGQVAGVIRDRPPYGNAVVIETSFDMLPAQWRSAPGLPVPSERTQPSLSLTCPAMDDFAASGGGDSLYLLYAHLETTPEVKPGDPVTCGEIIGRVGTSGNSVNPHLHLEARVGPAQAPLFDGMAHYTTDATPAEQSHYCLWRLSGRFPSFDPLTLLTIP